MFGQGLSFLSFSARLLVRGLCFRVGFRAQGFGGLGLGVWGFGVGSLGFGVQGVGVRFRVQGSGVRVNCSGSRFRFGSESWFEFERKLKVRV